MLETKGLPAYWDTNIPIKQEKLKKMDFGQNPRTAPQITPETPPKPLISLKGA